MRLAPPIRSANENKKNRFLMIFWQKRKKKLSDFLTKTGTKIISTRSIIMYVVKFGKSPTETHLVACSDICSKVFKLDLARNLIYRSLNFPGR